MHIYAQQVLIRLTINSIPQVLTNSNRHELESSLLDSLLKGELDAKKFHKQLRLYGEVNRPNVVDYFLDLEITDTLILPRMDQSVFIYYDLYEAHLSKEDHQKPLPYYGRGGIKGAYKEVMETYLDWLRFSVDCALANIPLVPLNEFDPVNVKKEEAEQLNEFREYYVVVQPAGEIDSLELSLIRNLIFNNFLSSQRGYYFNREESGRTFNLIQNTSDGFTLRPIHVTYLIEQTVNGYLIRVRPETEGVRSTNGLETVPDTIFIDRSLLLRAPSQMYEKIGTGVGRIIRLNWN